MSTMTVDLPDTELEYVRREMMKAAARDLRNCASQLEDLAIVAPWPAGTQGEDVENAVRAVRESLGLLDRFGYPTRDDS